MNTFLPYPDFNKSARCLDDRRLNKQVLECDQILGALERQRQVELEIIAPEKIGWINHPAVRQWKGYTEALKLYRNAMLWEWVANRRKNTTRVYLIYRQDLIYPPWLGDKAFHASHRSNLLRKDPEWYGQFGWTEPHDLPYVWPSKKA